jgi:predicted dehydrogenase
MARAKVRVVVLGAGSWATTVHIPALQQHPDAEVVGLWKRGATAARRFADDFSIPFASDDVRQLIRECKPDAAIVSSVAALHYEQAKVALEAGLHVLIEKPMTFTADQAQELQDIADRSSLHFLISHPWHYNPHAVEARRLVQSGALGDVKLINQLFTNFGIGVLQGLPYAEIFGRNPTPQNLAEPYAVPGQTSYSDPSVSGGGQIYSQVPHALAFLAFMTGRRPTEVFARFDNAGLVLDVYDTLSLRWDDGSLSSTASCLLGSATDRQHEVRVYGTAGMLLIELWKGTMELHDREDRVHVFPDLTAEEAYPVHAPALDLVDTILGRSGNGSPASLGVTSMYVVEAATESARTGSNVQVREPATRTMGGL